MFIHKSLTMKTLLIHPSSINDRHMDLAVKTLAEGGVVLYPTDTLYAVGCDALNNQAVQRVCRAKGINPDKQSLSVICADMSMASEYARIDNNAFRMLRDNLPGPFTFILPASTKLPKVFKGRRTVGVRIPRCEIARELSSRLGRPLLTTTAQVDDDETMEVKYAALADLMIDGGEAPGEPSTVVDLTDSASPQVVREGAGTLQ